MRRFLRLALPAVFVALAAAGGVAGTVASQWAEEAVQTAERHARFEVAHPGWSFPARVRSAPTPLDLPPKRLVAEAQIRGYTEDCGANPAPATYCSRTGRVIPSDPTADALEPVVLGWLIGPDAEIREHLPLDEAPRHLLDAILAAEDREFHAHHGVNVRAMLRAALANAQQGSYAQGGSTLTMQVVRNLAQAREKTVTRKLREMVAAWAVDRALGKEGVLQMYLDAPYLGQQGSLSVCGFEAAAQHYFGKSARDVTLAEAATLAAILPAPGRYAPDRNPEAAKQRRDRVLQAMAELYGYDVTEALATPVTTVPPPRRPERWPAYLSATRAWLERRLPAETLYGAGLDVIVGVDPVAQEEAERLFPEKTRWFQGLVGRRHEAPLQAAGVMLDTATGLLRAVYGGADVTSTSFNRATQARRQPGSSFKPVVYALAFESVREDGRPWTAADVEPNAPRTFRSAGDWKPRNVGGSYSPTVSLAQGLAWSQNIATASLLEDLGGPEVLIPFAARLGFDTTAYPHELGLALGQAEATVVEMAQFAAIVANGGFAVTAIPVLRAVDPAGVERIGPPTAGERVLSAEAAALTRELMRLVIDVGTGGASRGAAGEAGYTGPAIGKTGTTDGEKDLWFVGASPTLATAVWIGFDEPAPIGASASDLAAPLWGWWMHRATRHTGELPKFSDEPALEHRWICTLTGKLANATCKTIRAPFLPGTAPKAACHEEHPPDEDPDEAAAADGDAAAEGAPKKKKYESLWKRMARERAEREAAEAAAAEASATDAPQGATGPR